MRLFRSRGALVMLAALAVPFSPALAQTGGAFTLTGSFAYDYHQVQHGATTFMAGHIEGGGIISAGEGALFPEGKTVLQSCLLFSETSADGLSLTAPCTLTESQEDGGDQLFALLTRKQGDLGVANSGGAGRVELVGGTGQYADVTGQCSYDTRYLSASAGVITWDCDWSRP